MFNKKMHVEEVTVYINKGIYLQVVWLLCIFVMSMDTAVADAHAKLKLINLSKINLT